MNLANWGPSIVTLLVTVSGFLFLAGQVTGRIKAQEIVVKSHDERLSVHDNRLASQDVEIGKLTAWREGYAAASVKHAGRTP